MSIKEIVDIIFGIFKTHPFKIISRKKVLLGIFLLLGLSLLLYQSLLALQLVKSKAMGFYFFSQRKLVNYQQKIIKDPQILRSKIDAMKNKLDNLEKSFVPERELTPLFNDLKGLINQTQNDLVSLDIKPMIAIETYQRLPFSISVKGHYVDIIVLLNRLEGYSHLIDIKDIKIQPTGESPSEAVLMNLETEIFVIKELR